MRASLYGGARLQNPPEIASLDAWGREDTAPKQVSEEDLNGKAKGNTVLGLAELLLKLPQRVDVLNRAPGRQREIFPRFLLIGEIGFFSYALVMAMMIHLAPRAALASSWLTLPSASWADGTVVGLVVAYSAGVPLAACVCLPSFYFYSLLAGVKITWLQISSLVGKGTAANAILLLGVLPIYVAIVLGLVVFGAPLRHLKLALSIGLALPFFTGLWGLRSIYLGIVDIAGNPATQTDCARLCFLRRLTFSWAAVYATVVPVMIYRLWGFFAEALQSS